MARTLLQAMQSLQESLQQAAARKQAALEDLHRDPARGIAQHHAALAALPALRAEADGVVALWRADPAAPTHLPGLDDWLRDELQGQEAGLELSLAMGHHRTGDSGACAVHLDRYLAASAGRRDPARAMALEMMVRQALEAGRVDQARDHATALDAEARLWTTPQAWQRIAPPGEEARLAERAGQQVSAARSALADLALAEGRRADYLALNREAQALAERAGADDVVRTLWWARTSYELVWDASGERLDRSEADVRSGAPEAVRAQPDFQRRLLQARAQIWSQRGRPERAIGLLQQALALPGADDPSARWTLHLDLAELHAGQGRHAEALAEAESALQAARALQSAPVLRQCLDRRRAVRQASGDPAALHEALAELDTEADPSEPATDTASRLQTRVMLLLALNRHDDALDTVEALQAVPPAARQMAGLGPAPLASLRAAVLRASGRVADAVAVLEAGARAMERERHAGGAWRDQASTWETLCFGAAINHAELGDADAALYWAERGREPLWAGALRRHGRAVSPLPLATLRAQLAAAEAAALVLLVGRQRTLAVLLPAHGAAPQIHRLAVGRADWQQRFEALDTGAAQWNPRFAANLEAFSAWLAPVLGEAVRGARRLVVAPEGLLSLVPFAGLRLQDGSHLAQHVATVLVPTLAFGARRASPPGTGSLLSAGAGRSAPGGPVHDFAAMAGEIAAAYGRGPATVLAPARRADFLRAAGDHEVLHLSFHGNVQPGRLDPLAASTLEFEGGERLSARQLLEAWPEGCPLESVFINACVSAGYAFDREAGAGGFMQAFLEAGARQLVATLAYVDPAQAQALAQAFYRAWGEGVDAATALQRAQCQAIADGAPPEAWASHLAVAAGF